ncbi:hypothetical protein CBOM_05243 [Ceraceosorus bombacis]|uniref:Uncharacterized protein n=1 Tax=Ceraceosorus bombacis TaxID=401625 RepID=A0A0P1BQV7_9BASI|nr:hypothetical protein CBOM_05243 [Ceraceosorus bombacis]
MSRVIRLGLSDDATDFAERCDAPTVLQGASGALIDVAATLPALSFVLASKRDAQRVYVHVEEAADCSTPACASPLSKAHVLAFEPAPMIALEQERPSDEYASMGAGNLFVYRSPEQLSGARSATSRVIRLGLSDDATDFAERCDTPTALQGASGALIDVAASGTALIQGKMRINSGIMTY